MPDIKTRTPMGKPKALGKSNVPKVAATLFKKQYNERQTERHPRERDAVQYATGKVADTERSMTLLAAGEVRHTRKSAARRRGRVSLKNATVPKKKNTPSGAEEPPKSIHLDFSPIPSKKSVYIPLRLKGKDIVAGQKNLPRCSSTERILAVRSYGNMPWVKGNYELPYAIEPNRKSTEKAKNAVKQKTQQQMIRRSEEAVKQEIYKVAQSITGVARTIAKKIKTAATDVAAVGGGAAVLTVVIMLLMIGAIAASPFGILLSNEVATSDSVPLSCAVAQVNYAFNAELEALQNAGTYDSITITGESADWADVLAVFAAKVAGSDGADAADVVAMDTDRISRLKDVFSDMSVVSCSIDTIEHPDSDPNDGTDDSWIEKNLIISIEAQSADDMKAAYNFTKKQSSAVDELLEQRQMLLEPVGDLNTVTADAKEILRNLPEEISPERRRVVEAACSLVGKVNYFWGGKSLTIGWDSRWGTLRKVIASGNSTTGTFRPYGLDCSGFVDWVFYNATDGAYYPGHGGGAIMQHRSCAPVSWEDAQPGDLAFYPDDSRVGIAAGRDEDGELLIIHCASGYNNVVIAGREGFSSAGNPF